MQQYPARPLLLHQQRQTLAASSLSVRMRAAVLQGRSTTSRQSMPSQPSHCR
jgi:hypothetical protein